MVDFCSFIQFWLSKLSSLLAVIFLLKADCYCTCALTPWILPLWPPVGVIGMVLHLFYGSFMVIILFLSCVLFKILSLRLMFLLDLPQRWSSRQHSSLLEQQSLQWRVSSWASWEWPSNMSSVLFRRRRRRSTAARSQVRSASHMNNTFTNHSSVRGDEYQFIFWGFQDLKKVRGSPHTTWTGIHTKNQNLPWPLTELCRHHLHPAASSGPP